MTNISSAIRDTVPISMFNRGLAGKIFAEVKHSGAKVVMKNNTAECVLLSPEEYMRLVGEIPNEETLAALNEVEEMKRNPSIGKAYTDVDEMMRELLA